MNFLQQIAIQTGLRKMDSRMVQNWIMRKDTAKLVFALQNGPVKIRTQVMDQLGKVNPCDVSLVDELIRIIHLDFLQLARRAAELLRPVVPQSELEVRVSIQTALDRLQDRLRREQNRRTVYQEHPVTGIDGVLIDKGQMKQLERVRQQLKKSIRLW